MQNGDKSNVHSPRSPRRLQDKVSFYEQVWSGNSPPPTGGAPTPPHDGKTTVDVAEMERRLEERRRRREEGDAREKVVLRSTPGSPMRKEFRRHWTEETSSSSNNESFEETYEKTVEEGDMVDHDGRISGAKMVQFERITIHKSVREITPKAKSVSRTPSEEQITREDSAYVSQKSHASRSSSITSLTSGKSEDNLMELMSPGESTAQHPSHDWYSEYSTQTFQNVAAKMEYVRSKSQYDSHIAEIRDEQERVQKKTFVNWINSYLSKRVPPLRVDDLIEDLKDGTKLLALLEVLSGDKLPVERGRNLRRPHFLSNANTALQFLQSKRIKLVNINSSDLVDGRPPVVLGLIWTIILYFQIEENTRALASLGHTFGGSQSSLEGTRTPDSMTEQNRRKSEGARKALLSWVSQALPQDIGIEVKDFGQSWRDGLAFLAMINQIRRGSVDMANLRHASNRYRLETAFDVAERELGVARLLDPEDVDVERPDERSVMTYVAQFLHKYPELRSDTGDTLSAVQTEYNELIQWLMERNNSLQHMRQTNSLPTNYMEYSAAESEKASKFETYKKLQQIVDAHSVISITGESWREIERLWKQLEALMRYWLHLLDRQLPPPFGQIGDWLGRAEEMIESDDIPTVMNEETATIISRKLEEHKAFFADLLTMEAKFDQAVASGSYQNQISQQQLESMGNRLHSLGSRAAQRRIRLKFLEHKCCLIAFLHLTENKLKGWTVKYGREDKVQHLLDQYTNFVSRNRIFQEFNKAYIDMQQVVEEYKREGNIDQKESISTDRFMRETADRWKNVSMELRCVQSMLEEVIAYWRRWNTLSEELEKWLNVAETKLQLPEEERMEFFQDLSVWKDKHQLVSDTVSFLIATCEDQVAISLKDKFVSINTRWENLFPLVKQYMHAGDILRNRKEYRAGVEKLQNWLRNAETILASSQLSSTEKIKAYGQQLQMLQSEVEEMEELFKNISKKFQTLIQDLSREEVDRMMTTLKKEKENLVRVRALIPMQIHLFHQILVQQESLEAGQVEIGQWLDNAEALLSTMSLAGGKEAVQSNLDRHKAFFSRMLYYKSMLDSKNKVFQSIMKSLANKEGIDTDEFKKKMSTLNERFSVVTQRATTWEQKLQETVRCWHNFREIERVITDWLNTAEKLMSEKHIDSKQTVENHKSFFEHVNDRWLQELVNATQDLIHCLPADQQQPVYETAQKLQARWKEVLSFAPLHLVRLEFRLDEATFGQYVKEMEKELSAETQAFNRNENVEEILSRNKECFVSGRLATEIKQCINNMKKVSTSWSAASGTNDMEETVKRAETQWTMLSSRAQELRDQLQHIPEKWKIYRQRFVEMVEWMNAVDNSVKNLLKELATAEEFEREKAVFQGICREVDSKREEMKWLVQTLDALIAHSPDAQEEQHKLQQLITRYKNLIPTIEMTVTRTDLYSKCYTYRKEVTEVCTLLEKVRESALPKPETLMSVETLLKQQETAVAQLDAQRGNIVSMLQRGKDLSKDTAAPVFVKEQVKALETEWNQAYNQTLEKLNQLKGTYKIWSTYQEQKNEILSLLERAENELKNVGSGLAPQHIADELRSKQELNRALKEATEQMLRRLRDLASSLTGVTAPDRKPVIIKEVSELEQRLQVTQEVAEKQVGILEQMSGKWTKLQNEVGAMKAWSVEAPVVVHHIKTLEASPQDKLKKAQLLKSQLIEREKLIEELSKEAQQFAAVGDDAEAQKLQAELAILQESVSALKNEIDREDKELQKDVITWQEYQTKVENLKPWLDQAELHVAMGQSKPNTLSDAKEQLHVIKIFEEECIEQHKQIELLYVLSDNLPTQTTARDTADALQARWEAVRDAMTQKCVKMERLVKLWDEMEETFYQMEEWLAKPEFAAILDSEISPDLLTEEELKQQLEELKVMSGEIGTAQTDMASLSQTADIIAQGLALEGSTILKNRIAELKASSVKISEAIRHRANILSDALLQRQEFNAYMAKFSDWLGVMESNVVEASDVVEPEEMDNTVLTLHALLQEHSDKQPAFNAIYDTVKQKSSVAVPEEAAKLNESYTKLAARYQDLEDKLHSKRQALEKWSELLSWSKGALQQLDHVRYHLESNQPVEIVETELEKVTGEIATWTDTARGVDILCEQSRTEIRGKSARSVLKELADKAELLQVQLNSKKQLAEKIEKKWANFQQVQQQLSDSLLATQGSVQEVMLKANECPKLIAAIEELDKIWEAHNATRGVKDNLTIDGKSLIGEDEKNAPTIQNILASIEANWEKVNELIKEKRDQLSTVNSAWSKFGQGKEKIYAVIHSIEDSKKPDILEVPNDSTQAAVMYEKAKKELDSFKRSKGSLDLMDSKAQIILKQAESLPGFVVTEVEKELSATHEAWQKAGDIVSQKVQGAEAQMVIWKQIDEAKNELLQWLGETNAALTDSIENVSDTETVQARLAAYRSDLESKQNLRANINTKTAQLLKLNDVKSIPTLESLEKLLDDEFVEVESLAKKLENVTISFEQNEKKVKDDIKQAGDKIGKIREKLIKCDNLTGENIKILERLKTCQSLKAELNSFNTDIENINTSVDQIKKDFPSFSDSPVIKELGGLNKRYSGVVSHANKIEKTLLTFLTKYHKEKLSALQRSIATYKEKVLWCKPEPGSDKYNIEAKMTSLQDLQPGLSECENKKKELNDSLEMLINTEGAIDVQELKNERDQIVKELEALQQSYAQTKSALDNNVGLWQKYEDKSESVSNWLKEIEGQIRKQGSLQADLSTIKPKIQEMLEFKSQIEKMEPEIKEMEILGQQMMQQSPESRVGHNVGQIVSRYQAATKFVNGYVDRLESLDKNQELYNSAIKEAEDWISDADKKLDKFDEAVKTGAKPALYQAKLEELKAFTEQREAGQVLLNKAVERGEALFAEITPANRDAVRAQLRTLRDSSEALIDKSNAITKKIETLLMQRSSFDDSYSQVAQWINDTDKKIGDKLELKATLQDKKLALHGYRTLAQDVHSHQTIFKQLQQKLVVLSDSEASNKLDEILSRYKELSDKAEEKVGIFEKHVTDHESYLQSLEKAKDFLNALEAEEAKADKIEPDAQLAIIENLLLQKGDGDKLIEVCDNKIKEVLQQTDKPGHAGLLAELDEQKKAWSMFLAKCNDTLNKLHQQCSRWNEFEENLDVINSWLKQKESQVKDQSLRSTQEAKQSHLNKLKTLEEEIAKKADEIATLQTESIEAEPELVEKVSKISTKYQALRNQTKEAISRYDQFVKEHSQFNTSHAEFLEWLNKMQKDLKEHSEIVGDLAILQERQKKLRELADIRSKESAVFEALVERGEKLYTHTSPDGREIIRQQLRTLRTLWDGFSDELQAGTHRLDQCLLQFAEFSLAQEQLTKWLKGVEKAMQQHTELKGTLQEKRAQLQNHKIMHQEITSHQQLVESVCDKAQQLVDQTQDKSLNVYLQSIKQLFQNIVLKSQDLLDNLEESVDKHNKFSVQCDTMKDWLATEKDKVEECNDVTGEKSDIKQRLETIKVLRGNKDEGNEKMSELQELFGVICKNTTKKGVSLLEKELKKLQEGQRQHDAQLEAVESRLQSVLDQWTEFEKQLDAKTKWFRATEVAFRDQQLQATLEQKEQQLASFKEKRKLITDKESEIDSFVDKSHALLHSSGADKIKSLISQISNRYQLLHVLSKEVINRWQGLVDDHRTYRDKYEETLNWLQPLEEQLAALRASPSTANVEVLAMKLHALVSEREQISHRLTSLTAVGERLYPDTAAPGREIIRQQLREIRDRCDALEEGIKEQQKIQDAKAIQWSSYQEALQQTVAWLDAVEKSLEQDPASSLTATQEIRSKLIKYKTTLQEVLSHKRVLEMLTEKAQALSNQDQAQNIPEVIQNVNKRYEQLTDNLLKTITQLEDSLDAFIQFTDLQKSHQEQQKQLWDRLSGLTDYSGNKPILQARLAKVVELQECLPEGIARLKALDQHIASKASKLPPRAKETMERDLNNLRFDFGKFTSAVGDVKQGLEGRLNQWAEYEGSMDRLLAWLTECETALKNYTSLNTLEEKQEQLNKYQDLTKLIDSHDREVSEIVSLADHLEQSMLVSLRQNEVELDKMTDESSELVQMSGEAKISVSVQQITSRFQSVQTTAKEIVKKCEQAVADHELYLTKYKECSNWLANAQNRYQACRDASASATQQDLTDQISQLSAILAERPSSVLLLNATVERGEKLYPSTAVEGREAISSQLEELQQALDALYDGVSSMERELQAKLSRWSGFEECVEGLLKWLKEAEASLPEEPELKATLDEKRAQLQVYRAVLHDATIHNQDIVKLRDKIESLPEQNAQVEQQLATITQQHAKILKRAQDFVQQYEEIVSNHQQYSKAVMEAQEWFDATHNTVLLWGDTDLERISLHTNLERLKNLQLSLPEEESRVKGIRVLGEKVLPGTIDSGQINIRAQIDSSQQDWEGLLSAVQSTIDMLESKLQQWSDYEVLKDQCMAWLRETDTKLHAIDLKATLQEKKEQLEILKTLQGEVRAKELEMDTVTERAQQLHKATTRNSQIAELAQKYQQVSTKVKDLNSRWHQYVSSHLEFDSHIAETAQWLEGIKSKLEYCSDLSASSQKDLEGKLETIQDLLLYKEEGFSRIQTSVELAQVVLANTAPHGHQAINQALADLQEQWSILATKMVETKTILDESIHKWAGFLENIQQLNKTVDYLQGVLNEICQFQTTMSEKRAQLERLKNLDEKVRCEKIEVESLKAKATEMLASGQQSHAATQAQEILQKFDTLAEKIKNLLAEREDQYRDHRVYKEAHDELIGWLSRAREKIPSLKQRSLSDKLAIENAVAPLEALLNKQAQGELLVEHMQNTGEVVIASSSPQGQEIVRNEVRALTESFQSLFKEIKQQKEQLEATVLKWREYKEEYERLSDWLQQMDILVKAQKTALLATVQEKEKQVQDVKEILDKLEKGQEQIDKFNNTASVLLSSHLDTYVNNQLRHLNSRYQVQVNLAKDVLRKVETNWEQHKQYEDNLAKAKAWIENAKEVIRECSQASSNSSRDVLQTRLAQIQDLLRNREEGQSLIHATVNCGEKVLRNTRSDGREVINTTLKEIQNEWERVVRKISTAKVHLETSLLQWADYSSSYSQLQQWITDREAKLQQVCEQKVSKAKKGQASGLSSLAIGERKATLRQTNSIMQDIVSFQPMIQSVTSKAEDLLQAAPASEISSKYETLSKTAKELYAKQKETVEQHQAFIDAGNEFGQWLRAAKERLGKCAEPTGDKESLSGKASQLKILQNELPIGEEKLQKALQQGEKTCAIAEPEDKEVIEEEVALLQEEFDNYADSLAKTKTLLELGIVKWTEYEEQHREATEWLTQTELLVQSYNKLQDSLEEKKNVLEQFQVHLQTLFDWQKELDRLNMKAQVLLETCADTRISNAVTQMTTKYNALLSLAKEMMRRLELHYQEHQQHSTLYQECQDWVDRTRDKVNECQEIPSTLTEVNNKLQIVKAIRQTLEQGQNRLRYALELKERVILNTEANGAAKIQEDTESLQQELEKLVQDVQDLRQKLTNRAAQLEEIHKAGKLLSDWLEGMEGKVNHGDSSLLFNDLSEKRATLEKFRSLLREIQSHSELVERVKSRLADDLTIPAKDFQPSLDKYVQLQDTVSKNIAILESQVKDHEAYYNAHSEALDWVRKTRIAVQQCGDPHGEKQTTLEKERKIANIASSLNIGESLVEKALEASKAVFQTTAPEGQEALQQETQQLKSDWEGLKTLVKDTQNVLNKCLNAWNDFTETREKTKTWVEQFQKKVDAESDESDTKTPEDLQRCHELLQEAVSQKPTVEELSDRCEALMELSACNWVRDETVRWQSAYTSLLTTVQSLVARVEKNLSDHTEFIKAKEELESWLQRAHGTVKDCIGSGDLAWAKDKLDTIKLVATRMTEGQHMMAGMQDVFSRAVNTTPSDQQESLREAMSELRNSWDQLSMDLNSVTAQLKALVARWEDFNDSKSKMESWLTDMEKRLAEKHDTKAELGEMKTLLERYKHIHEEIQSQCPELEHLLEEGAELAKCAGKDDVVKETKELEKRWKNLDEECKGRRESVEKEIQEHSAYQQSLQETEKWLLQISFQLMAHNSLYITNREQTLEQIVQHDALLGEIQRYQATLDDLKGKGYRQIDRYVAATPNIKPTIEHQLSNVQESYNSLLHTARQIKARLDESLAKFQEYEDTLESIMANLDEYEPQVTQEIESDLNLSRAQQHLETTRLLHNKLQAEKSRLAVAVQACEAAAACISRPSSPQDAAHAPIPDREIAVRVRLEDLIDQSNNQDEEPKAIRLHKLLDRLETEGFLDKLNHMSNKVQVRLSGLTSTVSELEEKDRQLALLAQWTQEQLVHVTEWRSRPAKLRPDAARSELTTMQELLTTIADKKMKLATELSAGDNSEIEQQLETLEELLIDTLSKKQAEQNLIDEYRKVAQTTQSWLDSLGKRLDTLEKGSGLDCQHKLTTLAEIGVEFNENALLKVEQVKTLANQVITVVSNLDSQQVEEQLKSVERRYNDIAKRIQRKAQVLAMTHKGLEAAQQEINQARDWVREKMAFVQSPPPLGYENKATEERLQLLRTLLKEAEGKQVLVESVDKRISALHSELEPSEIQQLEGGWLRLLESEVAELCSALRGELDRVGNAAQERKVFEDNLANVRGKLRNMASEDLDPAKEHPLTAAAVEKELEHYKEFENELKDYGQQELTPLQKQANALIKDCDEADKVKLQGIIQGLTKEFEGLQKKTHNKVLSYADLLAARKKFEADVERCQHWLNEAEVALSAEVRTANLELIQEQLNKYAKLSEECVKVGADLDQLDKDGRKMLLSSPDLLTLTELLSGLRDRHSRIASAIKDKIKALGDALSKCKEAHEKADQSLALITRIQAEMKELQKPIGSKVEDVQGLLDTYQKLLDELKNWKNGLLDLEDAGVLQGVIQQQDDLIRLLEDQIARLRQLLLLREQFIALVTDITTFITRYTDIVHDIETGGHSVQEKIKKYDDVIVKIQECEALLATATDKGEQIANEGSAADRNNITAQLQSLKQQLTALRRAVERQREQHEAAAAEHMKLISELDGILEWLHAHEAEVKSRPLLNIDVASVEQEQAKHEELAKEVESYLNRIREVQQSVKHEDGLPSTLTDQLSEANLLLTTLPQQLEERAKYLEDNKKYRENYQALCEKLHAWVWDAEVKIEAGKEGVDYENVARDLEDHKIFFSTESNIRELVSQQIQAAANEIWPSLSSSEQEELSLKQQRLTQLLKNTLNLAKSRQAQLEQDAEIWKYYQQSLDRVKATLARAQFTDDPVTTLAGVHFNIQKITHAQNDTENHQPEMDLLIERSREIQERADPENKAKVETEVNSVSTDWVQLISGLEARRDALTKLAHHWEEFESKMQNFESLLASAEERCRHLDVTVRSKPQIAEVSQTIQEFITEVKGYQPQHEEVLFLSGSVLTYLDAFSEVSSRHLKDKLNSLTDTYKKLIESLEEKGHKVNEDLAYIEHLQAQIEGLNSELIGLQSETERLYVFGENQKAAEDSLNKLESDIFDAVSRVKALCSETRNLYNTTQQLIPTDIDHQLTSLELVSEGVVGVMEEKGRELKRAKTVRSEYTTDVDEIQNWLRQAELKVQDRSVQPLKLKEYIQEIQKEIPNIKDRLLRATKNGQTIIENTQDEDEKKLVQSTLDTLQDQLNLVETWVEEKKQQVSDSLDAWQRFLKLYETVMSWVAEKKTFLAEPMELSSLPQARQKLNDYSTAVKSCKQISKNISEMSKELEALKQSTDTGDLHEKMEEAEIAKTEIEAQLVQRNALLHETSEEWEQCERKMKEVRNWIDKSRQNLESAPNKKKPLRDQVSIREKMQADIEAQRTKISLSVEKLQLHFRSGIGGDTKVTDAAVELLQELDQLLSDVKEQTATLEATLAQLDQYQQEIQQLKQQVVQVEQQLRVVMSPTYLPHDRDKATEDQNACRERVRALQSKISARTERVKLLLQRATPDLDPLLDS